MNYDEIKDQRIAVLLSGGVDSSVVVHEFAQYGLTPDCFYIRIGLRRRRNGTATPRKTLRWLLLLRAVMVVGSK